MTDFSGDEAEIRRIEAEIRRRLDAAMAGAARISEFTVDTPIGARPPLSPVDHEVAVALNAAAELLYVRAHEAAGVDDLRWEGLADAATMLSNAIGYRGLPQVAERHAGGE